MIQLGRHQLHHGDALDVLRTMPDASVDAVVTDPPYGLGKEPDALAMLRDWLTTGSHAVTGAGFMGREWDTFVPQPVLWSEVLRVLKPGGHALVFAGTRTQDLMGLALRIAEFEVRDCLQWIYGTGFPKHSSALKPAYEPVLLVRKPIAGTVAENVVAHGTGCLNIDAARIGTSKEVPASPRRSAQGAAYGNLANAAGDTSGFDANVGRWPANVVLDEVAAELLDAQTGDLGKSAGVQRNSPRGVVYGGGLNAHPARDGEPIGYGDSGGASRFFYCAKASTSERGATNKHPTVKPLALMRWLCKLITPPGGVILDPFAGSGTTLLAADALGFSCVAIEREADHVDIIRDRFEEAQQSAPLFAV